MCVSDAQLEGKHVFWHKTTISKCNPSGSGYLLVILELLTGGRVALTIGGVVQNSEFEDDYFE